MKKIVFAILLCSLNNCFTIETAYKTVFRFKIYEDTIHEQARRNVEITHKCDKIIKRGEKKGKRLQEILDDITKYELAEEYIIRKSDRFSWAINIYSTDIIRMIKDDLIKKYKEPDYSAHLRISDESVANDTTLPPRFKTNRDELFADFDRLDEIYHEDGFIYNRRPQPQPQLSLNQIIKNKIKSWANQL